jgi:hypothetical protein
VILPADQAWLAIRGLKTSHRIPYDPGMLDAYGINHRHKVGRVEAVQPGAGRQAIGRVVITDVRTEQLGDLTDEAARAEGEFLNFGAFIDDWETRHGPWDDDLVVWVLEFKPERAERPRWLHVDSSYGYTCSPARAVLDAGEAVGEDWQKAITDRARERALRREKRAEVDRAALSTEDRLRLAREQAAKRRVDISREVRMLEHMQRQGRPRDVVVRQLGVVERQAYRTAA